jgi:hypothetical protein
MGGHDFVCQTASSLALLLTSTRVANAWLKRRLRRKVLHWSEMDVRAYYPAFMGPFFTSPAWFCLVLLFVWQWPSFQR